jgi:hypothetical protein
MQKETHGLMFGTKCPLGGLVGRARFMVLLALIQSLGLLPATTIRRPNFLAGAALDES